MIFQESETVELKAIVVEDIKKEIIAFASCEGGSSTRICETDGKTTFNVDNLLTSFYQLDDEARKKVVETIQFKLQYHKDQERAEQVKQIKGW